ncbi:hypothetical protein QI305_12135 [Staphylococcus saprophyticus]|nr:hypothetical protein [Staphylococcus saprophyticus]
MSEEKYRRFNVTFRIVSGQILSYNVTARSLSEAQDSIIKHLKDKGIVYTSVHGKMLSRPPIVPKNTYIER